MRFVKFNDVYLNWNRIAGFYKDDDGIMRVLDNSGASHYTGVKFEGALAMLHLAGFFKYEDCIDLELKNNEKGPTALQKLHQKEGDRTIEKEEWQRDCDKWAKEYKCDPTQDRIRSKKESDQGRHYWVDPEAKPESCPGCDQGRHYWVDPEAKPESCPGCGESINCRCAKDFLLDATIKKIYAGIGLNVLSSDEKQVLLEDYYKEKRALFARELDKGTQKQGGGDK